MSREVFARQSYCRQAAEEQIGYRRRPLAIAEHRLWGYTKAMKSFETDAKVGPQGVLTLQQLPFADGQSVHVRIEPKLESTGPSSRILGLHEGLITISEDFDEPLPDSFWLGKDASDEASA